MQTVLAMLLFALLPLVAPLTPHLAEEAFLKAPKKLRDALSAHRSRRICALLGPTRQGLAKALGLCGPLTSVFQVGVAFSFVLSLFRAPFLLSAPLPPRMFSQSPLSFFQTACVTCWISVSLSLCTSFCLLSGCSSLSPPSAGADSAGGMASHAFSCRASPGKRGRAAVEPPAGVAAGPALAANKGEAGDGVPRGFFLPGVPK